MSTSENAAPSPALVAAAEAVRAELHKAAKKRATVLDRRLAAVHADLARLAEVGGLQRTGRMLLAQGAGVPRGATRATLDDWEAGGSIEVTLDPARPAKDQAEGFFAKAKRLRRGEPIMRRRLQETEAALALARERLAAIEACEATPEAIRALRLALFGEAPKRLVAPSRPKPAARLPFHTFVAAGGDRVLVGRGAKDNDALTTQHAKPRDLWLHAKGWTGAHVVVPRQKGQGVTAELLIDAATLAAHFSDARGETLVEVSYVERRYVRKPKGSPPGAVTIDREKVTLVRVEPERLRRLLATKDAA